MSTLSNIAWKNIWRNRLRSLVIMSATSLGIFAGLLLISFSMGMTNARISNALNTEISHIQIHRPEFIIRDDINLLISSCDSIEASLGHHAQVAGCSSRIRLNSIASSAETGANVKITGIDPEKEMRVTNLHTKIVEGDYFGKDRVNQVVVGRKLAEKLKIRLNSKIVLQIQDLQGNVSPAAFRVSGIYKTDNSLFDEFNLFVRNRDLRRLTGIEATSAHEIAIFLKDYQLSRAVQDDLKKALPKLEVYTWKELDAMLNYISGSMDQYLYFIMVIILLALIFGIVNTMMMAIMERVKELGMLMAIGMNRRRIVLMILYETVLLILTGALFGIGIGLVAISYLGHHGIDLSLWGKGLGQFGIAPVIYTTIRMSYIIEVVVMVILTGFLAAVFPVLKAIRLSPVQALKSDN